MPLHALVDSPNSHLTRTTDPHSTPEMPSVGSAGEILQIYEGTSQIQRVIIARELFDRG